jgi:hypothetical protein
VSSGFSSLGVAFWPLVPKFAGSNLAEAVRFFMAKNSSACLPSEGKQCGRCHVADLQHVKDTYKWREISHLSAKLPAISRPLFPLSLLEVSRVVVGVGAPCGASGNFQSRASTNSLHGCCRYGGASHQAQHKKVECPCTCCGGIQGERRYSYTC